MKNNVKGNTGKVKLVKIKADDLLPGAQVLCISALKKGLDNGIRFVNRRHGNLPHFWLMKNRGSKVASCIGIDDIRVLVIENTENKEQTLLKYETWKDVIVDCRISEEAFSFYAISYDCEYSKRTPPEEYKYHAVNGFITIAKIIPYKLEWEMVFAKYDAYKKRIRKNVNAKAIDFTTWLKKNYKSPKPIK